MSSTRLCQKLGWPGPSNPEKQLYSTLQIQARTTRCGLWWRYPSPQVRAVKYGLYQYGHHNVMCIRGRMSGERGGVLQSFWGSLSYLICPLQRSIASHRIASHRIDDQGMLFPTDFWQMQPCSFPYHRCSSHPYAHVPCPLLTCALWRKVPGPGSGSRNGNGKERALFTKAVYKGPCLAVRLYLRLTTQDSYSNVSALGAFRPFGLGMVTMLG